MSSEQLLEFLQLCPDPMLVVNELGKIVLANQLAVLLFRDPGDLVGTSVEELMPSSVRDRHVRLRQGFVANPSTRPMGQLQSLVAQRRDGTTFPAEIHLSPLPRAAGPWVLCAVRDVTEPIRLRAESLRASRLEQSNRELQGFASVASHDLQEPLRKMRSLSELVLEEQGHKLDDEGREYLHFIRDAAARMQAMVKGVLSLARASKGNDFVPCDLQALLKEVLEDLALAVQDAEAEILSDPLPVVVADPLQMRQFFMNVLSNALKYRRSGVKARVEVRLQELSEDWELSVSDNGIGLSSGQCERIFAPFQRFQQSKSGNGIGLALCRQIAFRHGGTLTARGTPGEGACFTLRLPKKPREEMVLLNE